MQIEHDHRLQRTDGTARLIETPSSHFLQLCHPVKFNADHSVHFAHVVDATAVHPESAFIRLDVASDVVLLDVEYLFPRETFRHGVTL